MTQAISIYDCTLLSVKSCHGTPDFSWDEPKPCSDQVTRVLGRLALVYFEAIMNYISPLAVIMADEGEEVLRKAILWLQKQQEKLRNGFSIEYVGKEYSFVVSYIDR